MAAGVKCSVAIIVSVVLVSQLVYCSRHSADVNDNGDGVRQRYGAVPRHSSAGHRRSRHVYTSVVQYSLFILDYAMHLRWKIILIHTLNWRRFVFEAKQ